MQQHIHTIVKHFFQKDSLQEVSETMLEKFAEEHPYSSVGHWLLARKVHDTASDRFPDQAARAVTWFNNPLWLDWTLGDHEQIKKALIVPAITVKDTPVEAVVAAPVAETASAAAVVPVVETAFIADAAHVAETAFVEETARVEETVSLQPTDTTTVETTPAAPAIMEAVPVQEVPVVSATTFTVETNGMEEEEETEVFIPGFSEPVSLIDPPAATLTPVANQPEHLAEDSIAAGTDPAVAIGSEVITAETTIEGIAPEEAHFDDTIGEIDDETDPAPEEEDTTADLPEVKISMPSLSLLAQEISLSQHKNISETEEPVFEPYHTIDYFASLGIKLRQEDMRDKLGIQLRSFTDWLRTMKRIAPVTGDASSPLDEVQQQSIMEIAGHSNLAREVITEAMADVWAKQGHPTKAIAIYEKLSLLNPAKSAYFASRIDQLKA